MSICEDVEKREPLYTVGGNVNWYSHYGRFLKKLKIELPYDPAIPLLEYISKGNEISVLKSYLHSHVHCSIIYNSQDMETTESVCWWLNGKRTFHTHIHTHTHTGILFYHKKEGNSAICSNVDEPGGHYAKWNKSDTERQIL